MIRLTLTLALIVLAAVAIACGSCLAVLPVVTMAGLAVESLYADGHEDEADEL